MSDYARAAWSDGEFLENVREARDNGMDSVCSICGGGIMADGEELHDTGCPLDPEHGEFTKAAAAWYKRVTLGKGE
jgi:hypothetical protein